MIGDDPQKIMYIGHVKQKFFSICLFHKVSMVLDSGYKLPGLLKLFDLTLLWY